MKHQYDLEVIQRFFSADKYAAASGIRIDSANDDDVVCSVELLDMHKNAAGNIQGGLIFTLCDFTFAVHSNLPLFRGADGGATVAQSVTISYLTATKGRKLYGRSAVLHSGRSTCVHRVEVRDDLGVLIAEALCNGFRTNRGPARIHNEPVDNTNIRLKS